MSITLEQLRLYADKSKQSGDHATEIICRDAAAEIERMRSAILEWREARSSAMANVTPETWTRLSKAESAVSLSVEDR